MKFDFATVTIFGVLAFAMFSVVYFNYAEDKQIETFCTDIGWDHGSCEYTDKCECTRLIPHDSGIGYVELTTGKFALEDIPK
jgi:hypothetical protein